LTTAYFSSAEAFKRFAVLVIWAPVLTGAVGETVKKIIEKTLFRGAPTAEIEQLFSHLDLIAPALAAAGVVILVALVAGLLEKRQTTVHPTGLSGGGTVSLNQAGWMGVVQGLALPFGGFSPSGSTISAGMLVGATGMSAG
jgi:undecaprenyl-diphosphatase